MGSLFFFVYFLQLIILNTFSCTFKSGQTGMLKMFFLNSQAVDNTTVYVSFVNNLVVLFSEEKNRDVIITLISNIQHQTVHQTNQVNRVVYYRFYDSRSN